MTDNAKQNNGGDDKNPTSPMAPEALAKILQYTANQDIPKDTQTMLNRPVTDPQELDEADEKFLKMVLSKIETKEINLYQTSSLMNEPVYEKLTPEAQSQAEIDALNLLTTMREIHKLYQAKQTDTYQFKNKLHQFRLTKERIEDEAGDIFVI